MSTFKAFIQSIQNDGNDGKAFEIFCKWFLENDPYWKTQVDEVWLWKNWPEKWQQKDLGIDLVFRHKLEIFGLCRQNVLQKILQLQKNIWTHF